MGTTRRLILIIAVAGTSVSALPPRLALAWERDLRGVSGEARSIAVTDAGDVIAAGFLAQSPRAGGLGVVRFHGRTGALLWKRIFNGEAHQVALDSRGNAIVAALTAARRRLGPGPNFAVIKLAGRDGALRWRRDIHLGNALAVAMDRLGDVVAAGSLGGEDGPDWVVLKLSGVNGAERWRQVIPGGVGGQNAAVAVVVDEVGDVVAAGRTNTVAAGPPFSIRSTTITVVKLAGADGRELWRRDLTAGADGTSSSASAVRLDPAGDVVVAGQTGRSLTGSSLQGDFAVFKLAGANGVELWHRIISESGVYSGAWDVAVDQGGTVVAVGQLPQAGSTLTDDFAAVKLNGRDGQELWRFTIDGTLHIHDAAEAVAVDSAGNVAVVGFIQDIGTGPDFFVTKLGTDGTELLRRIISNGGADVGWAVAIDRQDHVLAGGMTSTNDARSSFTVATFP